MERLENEEFDKRRIIEAKAGVIAERQLERKEKELAQRLLEISGREKLQTDLVNLKIEIESCPLSS